jgi:small multidrug resistance pump
MHWILLGLAIISEVCGTTCMKLSEGFSNLIPSVMVFVFYGVSFALFIFALKKIDLSFAYAVWAGLGTMVVALIGMLYFKEPATALKIGSILLIAIGVAGLNLGGAMH